MNDLFVHRNPSVTNRDSRGAHDGHVHFAISTKEIRFAGEPTGAAEAARGGVVTYL